MTLVDAAWRWGDEIRSAGTRLVALAEAEAAEPAAVARVLDAIEQAARALRANLPREPAPALAPDALEQQAAADATRVRTRLEGVACDP